MGRRLALSLIVVVLGTLSGCVSPPHVYNMTLRPSRSGEYAASRALTKEVNMGAMSSADVHFPPWAPRVDGTTLRVVLKRSLKTAHLLARKDHGKYALSAKLLEVKQPMAGFSMTVTTAVRYTLKRVSDQAVVFGKTITTSDTATMADEINSISRLRVATAKSVQRNITRVVNALYALNLAGPKVSMR